MVVMRITHAETNIPSAAEQATRAIRQPTHTQAHVHTHGSFLIQRVSPQVCCTDPSREQVRFGAREGVSDELGGWFVPTR